MSKIEHKADYKIKRQEEYPSIEDQLDAIWKGGEEMEKMRARILEIKNKWKKEQQGKQ